MGTIDLPPPTVGPLSRLAPKPIKFVLNWGRRYSLWVFNFGLACCAIEFIATSMARHDFIRLGVIPFAPGPRQADLMVVSGTVSDKMAPAVRRLYEQMPEPKYVISFGACSNCGGPYWDSYCVTKGVDQIVPVDVYVPGCPPRPEALLHGIVHLQEKIAAESLGDRYNAAEPVTPPPPPRPLEATVLRRPLLPPPPENGDDETFGHWDVMAEETGGAVAAPAAEPVHEAGAEDETMPVQHLGDHLGDAPEPASPPPAESEAAPPPVRPDEDETRPVPVVEEPVVEEQVAEEPAATYAADDATLPVSTVEDERPTGPLPIVEDEQPTGPVPAVEEGRPLREHDPSIIPGLTDDGHDDEIGRDR